MARPTLLRRSVLRSIQGPNLLGNLAIALGFTTREQLTEALKRQNQTQPRPRLGEVLVSCGYLSQTQLETLLDMQEAATSISADYRFGQIAVSNGLVTKEQLEEALASQRGSGRRLGEVLVERGALDPSQLDILLVAQRRLQAEQTRISRALAVNDFSLNEGEEWTVGRGPENQVVLPDPEVARRHARIYVKNGHFLVEDLGSLSGTWVDGGRITGPTVIKDGATMVFGNTVIAFSSRPTARPTSPTAPRSSDTRLIVRRRRKAPRSAWGSVASVAAVLVLLGGMAYWLVSRQRMEAGLASTEARVASTEASVGVKGATLGGEGSHHRGGEETSVGGNDASVGGNDASVGGNDASVGGNDASVGGKGATPDGRGSTPLATAPPSPAEPASLAPGASKAPPDALADALRRAGEGPEEARRQAVLDLAALGDRGKAEARRVLAAWRASAWKELCTPAEASLSRRMAGDARELFDLRVAAILKISDPAYDHHQGQDEVDRAVERVRAFVQGHQAFVLPRLSTAQRDRLDRIDWIDGRLAGLGVKTVPVAETIRLRRDRPLRLLDWRLPYEPRRPPQEDEETQAANEKLRGEVSKEEWDLVMELNAYRTLLGRPLLRLVPALCKAARTHSEWMNRTGTMDHIEPEASRSDGRARGVLYGYQSGRIGENILMGWSSGEEAHRAWYKSAPHHRNMLMLCWGEVGVGRCNLSWTEDFGCSHRRTTTSGGRK